MKPIKKSVSSIRKKYHKSFANKSADLLEKPKREKSSDDHFQPQKYKHKKGSGKVSETTRNDLTTSSLKYFFSPVKTVSECREGGAAAGGNPKQSNISNYDAMTMADLRNTIFIVLDSLDDGRDSQHRTRPKRSIRNVKPSPKKVSTRRKGNVKKKPTFAEPSPSSDRTTAKKKSINDVTFLSKSRRKLASDDRNVPLRITGKNNFRQQAAGDGEKKDKNPKKQNNGIVGGGGVDDEDENKSQKPQGEEITENRQLVTTYDNISRTFLDICLPFTYAGRSPPEEDISKVDGKFIRSLIKLAKTRDKTESRKKLRKNKNKKTKSDESSCEDQNSERPLNKHRKDKKLCDDGKPPRKSKKRLHHTQNVYFVAEIETKPLEKPFDKVQSKIHAEKRFPEKCSPSRKAKIEGFQLSQIKSEKLKRKSLPDSHEKNRKYRGKTVKTTDPDALAITLGDDGSKVTEIWRNEARVTSENSLSSHSSDSIADKAEPDYPPDFEMRSYRILQKIVEDEVQRICKGRQQVEEKIGDEVPKTDVAPAVNQEIAKEMVEPKNESREDPTTKPQHPPEPKKAEAKLYQKLTIPATKNLYDISENKVSPNPDGATNEKEDKLDKLKLKLNSLAQETNDGTGKIPNEIVKNWLLIRRLEKAFLALGTPAFPNKNSKNSIGSVSQTRSKDTARRNFQQEKTFRPKARINNYCSDSSAKSQIPVLATSRYEALNRNPYEHSRADRIETAKRMSQTEDLGNSDIYFFSLEPSCHQRRRSSSKTFLEGLENRKFEKILVNGRESFGKCDVIGRMKKKVADEEQTALNDDREVPPPIQWLKSITGPDKSLSKLPPKPKSHLLETKFIRKSENQFNKNHSTHTIFPAPDENNQHVVLKRSSSRTYVIDSDSDEQMTLLERKETFDVIPGKNTFMKSLSYTKTTNNEGFMTLKNQVTQRGSTDFTSNKSKTAIDREVFKKSSNAGQTNKTGIPRKTVDLLEKVRNIDQYEGNRLSKLDIARKNFLVKQNKKRRYQQSEVEKILIPWDDGTLNSKTSHLPQKSDETVNIENECHVNESTLTVAIENNNEEPLKILICKDFEPETTSQNQSYDSSISTNTYDVSDARTPDANSIRPLSCHSSLSKMSTSTFNVIPIQRRDKGKKTERCLWERDIKQYREIVKDIMSQYQRTNGFLKQSQQITARLTSRNFGSENNNDIDERDRHFAGHIANIAEYRRKIMFEYNAVPLVDYKSKILEGRNGRSRVNDSHQQRNLLVAKVVSEDIDSDVKDYQPNIHKILDSQLYVDTKNIGKRIRTTGKYAEKVISLQDTFRFDDRETRKTTGSQSLRQIDNPSFPVINREPETENVLGEASVINSLTSISDNQSLALESRSPLG